MEKNKSSSYKFFMHFDLRDLVTLLVFVTTNFPPYLMFSQECCLCNLRGGALKKTQNDK